MLAYRSLFCSYQKVRIEHLRLIAALKTAQLHKIPGWTETSRTQQTIDALTLALLIIGTAMRRSAT